ncbi:MAG TPA: DUF1178 family protein [Methylocella sp.]|jgi:hypothetical protein|nr:DUF1178 family protein [Methylocella sp.]
MIKFALLCARGHEFQSWFQSSEAFDTQVKSGLVSCPLCQVTEVTKAIMAPAIASRGEAERAKPPARAQSQTKVALLDRHDLKSRAMIDAFRRRIFAEAEDVGSRFAEEARNIHSGLVPERAIHGQASIGDARALIEDGVPVLPVPPSPDEYN